MRSCVTSSSLEVRGKYTCSDTFLAWWKGPVSISDSEFIFVWKAVVYLHVGRDSDIVLLLAVGQLRLRSLAARLFVNGQVGRFVRSV